MASINISSIMSKVKDYAKSDEGKRKMSRRIYDYRVEGKNTTDAGSHVTTLDEMDMLSHRMIDILIELAAAHQLPASVQAHFDSLVASDAKIVGKEGKYYVKEISFTDDLSRLSLKIVSGDRAGQYTGTGIDNIVSLFDTGYDAKKTVSGVWDGHEERGEIDSFAFREGLHFMREAVDEFNSIYGATYNVSAYISADSRFYYGNDMVLEQ